MGTHSLPLRQTIGAFLLCYRFVLHMNRVARISCLHLQTAYVALTPKAQLMTAPQC